MQVIYGDTDSIMIHTGLDDIEEVKAISAKVIQEVGWITVIGESNFFEKNCRQIQMYNRLADI